MFIDEFYKVEDIMGVSFDEKAKLADNQLKGVPQVWFT